MAGVPNVPPGLEPLLHVGDLSVKQTRTSAFQYYGTYDLFGPDQNLLYQATEQRDCCGPRIDLRVTTPQGYNVLQLLLPSNICSWDTELQVSGMSGVPLGRIQKEWASFSSSFDILDPSGTTYLKVKGPGWGESFLSDANYKVLSADKVTQIGVITRVWRGVAKEMFSTKDYYSLQFPQDLLVHGKAMLVACTLFIDLLEEERRRNQQSSS